MLATAARNAKTDHEKTAKLDLETIADIVTAIKLLTNADYRSVMTKHDVGIDPNNADQLLKMLDSIPSDPTKELPNNTRKFVRAVALMSKSQRSQEMENLKALLSSDKHVRAKAQDELTALSSKIIKAIERLKAKVNR